MASFIGQWTRTISNIFRKGVESCKRRIKKWLAVYCFIECYRIGFIIIVYCSYIVLIDGRFTQFQVFRNSNADCVDICSDTMCC